MGDNLPTGLYIHEDDVIFFPLGCTWYHPRAYDTEQSSRSTF